jgi:hypothetical protein
MNQTDDSQNDVQLQSDIGALLSDGDTRSTVVIFDMKRLAAVLDVPEAVLVLRMVRTLAGALAVDAAELADEQMQERGQRFGVDGFPEGWPYLQLAAVTSMRLFPERVQ